MPESKIDRRKFIQRIGFMLTGATVGGGLAAKSGMEQPQQAKQPETLPEPEPDMRQEAPRGPQLHNPPLHNPTLHNPQAEPGRKRTLLEMWQDRGPPPAAEQPGHVEKLAKRRRKPEESTPGEHIARGAVAGGVVGLGVHLAMSVNSRKNAEMGATQNDPERVEWERYQQRERDRQQREHDRNRDHEL